MGGKCYLDEFVSRQSSPRSFIQKYRRASEKALAVLPIEAVIQLIELLDKNRQQDRQIFVCGNGGSAVMASHLASELSTEPLAEGSRRFRVYSLTDNVTWISAIANDTDYSKVFVEQLKNLAREGDLLIAFSCSGNSENVIEAVRWATQNGLTTVGITGQPGGRLAECADLVLAIPSSFTPQIQEGHMQIQHLISYYFAETQFH